MGEAQEVQRFAWIPRSLSAPRLSSQRKVKRMEIVYAALFGLLIGMSSLLGSFAAKKMFGSKIDIWEVFTRFQIAITTAICTYLIFT